MAQGQCTQCIMINKDFLFHSSSEAGVFICIVGYNIRSFLVGCILGNCICDENYIRMVE